MKKGFLLYFIFGFVSISGVIYAYTLSHVGWGNSSIPLPTGDPGAGTTINLPPIITTTYDVSILRGNFAGRVVNALNSFNNTRVKINLEEYVQSPDQSDPLLKISTVNRTSIQDFLNDDVAAVAFQNRTVRVCVIYMFNVRKLDNKILFSSELLDFQSVLTHEIGHCAGLDHSSKNQAETNPLLRNASMYYTFADHEVRGLNSDDIAGLLAIYGKRPPSNISEAKDDFRNSINLNPNGPECAAVICYLAGYCG